MLLKQSSQHKNSNQSNGLKSQNSNKEINC